MPTKEPTKERKPTSAAGRQDGGYQPPILTQPKGGPIPNRRPETRSRVPIARHLPGKHNQLDHAHGHIGGHGGGHGGGGDHSGGSNGMPATVVSTPVARGRAAVSRRPGREVSLTVGDRHVELHRDYIEQFRAYAIDARVGDRRYAHPDGVYRIRAHTGPGQHQDLVSIRPVPDRYVDEDGRPIANAEDTDGEAYFAEYDLVIDEDDSGFDNNPSIRVSLADLDPQESHSGIYGALLRTSAAERVDGGAGPIDVYSPRNGRVGFRMKGDDGKPVEVEFGSKDLRAIDRAIDAVQEQPGTRTVESSHGPVEVTYTEHGSLSISPPSGGPWGIAASGDGVPALMAAFQRNGEAAGIFH